MKLKGLLAASLVATIASSAVMAEGSHILKDLK